MLALAVSSGRRLNAQQVAPRRPHLVAVPDKPTSLPLITQADIAHALAKARTPTHGLEMGYELARTATHEAGHAYWAWRRRLPISHVSVVPGTDYRGMVEPERQDANSVDRWLANTRRRKLDLLGLALAGPVAEQLFDDSISWERACDFNSEGDGALALRATRRLGLNDREAAAYVLFAAERVRRVLERPEKWSKVTSLALELMVRGTMTASEAGTVLNAT